MTAVARGTANTRWRDFVDVYLLSRHHPLDGDELQTAILDVAAHRGVELLPLTKVLDGFGDLGQAKWSAWRRKQLLEDRVPSSFDEVVGAVAAFADPVITGAAARRRWDPRARTWR